MKNYFMKNRNKINEILKNTDNKDINRKKERVVRTMRIHSVNNVGNYMYLPSTKQNATSKEATKGDQIEMSQTAREHQLVKKALETVPDIRMDKIKKIEEQIKAGTYTVQNEDVVNKLVEHYFDQIV